MILIISESYDPTTDSVIRWLLKNKQEVIRVNSFQELINGKLFVSSEENFKGSRIFDNELDKIKSIWFRRRPDFSNKDKFVKHKSPAFLPFTAEMNSALIYEELVLNDFMEKLMEDNFVIGNVKNSSLNKLSQLKTASHIGMKIPDTAVITNKEDLLHFANRHSKIIVKPLNNMAFIRIPGVTYSTYTKLVTKEFIDRVPDQFSPSLFQEYIEKEFEIRSFFLKNEEYSMAIFSQGNAQTQVDFRKYDHTYPNRRVPFRLPLGIKKMALKFMRTMGINTGSFDFMYSANGDYIFLEVNPVGQFGMVSIPCNYYIEQRIAERLTICK